jgi:hypothetical protein
MQAKTKTQLVRLILNLRAALNNGTAIRAQLDGIAQTVNLHRIKEVSD